MSRLTIVLLPLLALVHCAPPPSPVGQARADAATVAACREHANEVYTRNNRDTIYTISSRDTPYSASYAPGVTDRGLAQLHAHDSMINDCIRNTGTETNRATIEASPAAVR